MPGITRHAQKGDYHDMKYMIPYVHPQLVHDILMLIILITCA